MLVPVLPDRITMNASVPVLSGTCSVVALHVYVYGPAHIVHPKMSTILAQLPALAMWVARYYGAAACTSNLD